MKYNTLVTLMFAALVSVTAVESENISNMQVYIGTYTSGASEGIYLLRLDGERGSLENLGLAGTVENPSFVALHPSRPLLYCVGQGAGPSGKTEGLASAFAINAKDGRLTLLNQQPTVGAGPCHVAVDRQGRHIIVANYGGGSITVLPIDRDGRLGTASDFKQHEGSSAHPQRQTAPHTHSVTLDAAGRYVFAADLGLDKIMIYRYNAEAGILEANTPAFAALAPGAGPRHFAFHPSGQYAYVVNELDSTVTAFAYTSSNGRLEALQTIGTLPKTFTGENTTAEIRVHPSGHFVYASNRGHDSIAAFAISETDGRLTCLGQTPTRGKTPRNFNISPDGRFLLAANQASDDVTLFRVNTKNGALEAVGDPIKIPTPVCVVFRIP